jgi:hypothetical protein
MKPNLNEETKPMNPEFQQYRFARIEAHRITWARLEAQFKKRVVDFDELEKAIAGQLETDATRCIPWRRSEIEQTGCREGINLAALEFYWEHRHKLRRASLAVCQPKTKGQEQGAHDENTATPQTGGVI